MCVTIKLRNGDGTHTIKQTPQVNNKGMIPIEKNISVIDENGNEYEATYPKRAKGLVKKGRARFVDDNTICLACPPDITEDTKMSDNTNVNVNVNTNANEETLNVGYILKQMAAIQQDNAHIYEALTTISRMPQNNSGEPGSPGDIAGQAKATAIADVVKCRETTNQKLLAFYEKVYDDLMPSKNDRSAKTLRQMEMVQYSSLSDLWKETIMEDLLTAWGYSITPELFPQMRKDDNPPAPPEPKKSMDESIDNAIDKAIDNAVNKAIEESINKSIEESISQEFFDPRP